MKYLSFLALCILSFGPVCSIPYKTTDKTVPHTLALASVGLIEVKQNTNKMEFMKLSIDCKLLIFEMLKFSDLISLAETNREHSYLSADVFRRRYNNKTIILPIPCYTDSNISPNPFDEVDRYIKIRHFTHASKVLIHFGHVISSLRIEHYYLPNSRALEIYKLVNSHCSETLVHFYLSDELEDAIEHFSKPFKAVEFLTLDGEFKKLSSSKFTFSELFPAVCNLDLSLVRIQQIDCTDLVLPRLTFLYIRIWDDQALYFSEADAAQLIKNHPKIRELILRYPSRNLLKIVANGLFFLEKLTLQHYEERTDDDDEAIYFGNLNKLAMERCARSMVSNVTFGNLQEFQTDAFPSQCIRWINFIESDKNLRHFQSTLHIHEAQIVRLAQADLNLEDVSILCAADVRVDSVMQFIESCKRLKRIQLRMLSINFLNTILSALKQRFREDWIITESMRDVYIQRDH